MDEFQKQFAEMFAMRFDEKLKELERKIKLQKAENESQLMEVVESPLWVEVLEVDLPLYIEN